MPSSVGLWAGAMPRGCSTPSSRCGAVWALVDRSPLGSAAGYGVPLPLRRETVAKALGFGGLDRNVATVQGGRGKLEAAALFWCVQLGHDLARLAQDVILYSAEEFGYLVLPAELATGSSIMPHKRNPDLFELTRGRAAALEGDLAAVLQVRAKLSSGYHRDFQLLKEPLMRGLDRAEAMLAAMAEALPRLGVDRERCAAALAGGTLATDEVMRRVEGGTAFRIAYREVAAAIRRGETFDPPPAARIVARRRSTGGLGDLGLREATARARRARRWGGRERARFDKAMGRLAGREAQQMTADRRKRHLKILELINTRAIHTQEELADALAGAGWEVTQSSVSRDIAALRLVKVDGAYRRPPRGASTPGPGRAQNRRERPVVRARRGRADRAAHTSGGCEPGGGGARSPGLAGHRRHDRRGRHHLPGGEGPEWHNGACCARCGS